MSGKYYWIGLEQMHKLTSTEDWTLEVVLENDYGQRDVVSYGTFKVGDSADNYRLTISNYNSGTTDLEDLFLYHNGAPFSTVDRVNDYGCADCNCPKNWDNTGWW